MAIHEPGQGILRPAHGGFVLLTVLVGLAFNMLPWRNVAGVPDILALIIAFWCVREPRKFGMGTAWLLGLFMDAGNGALIGQHAFAYAILAFMAGSLHRRILWFPPWQQALHVLIMLLISQFLMLAVRMMAGGAFPGLLYFAGSFIAAAMWPAATFLMLVPQRRPNDDSRAL
jgi:rod shape-determining protein MreD